MTSEKYELQICGESIEFIKTNSLDIHIQNIKSNMKYPKLIFNIGDINYYSILNDNDELIIDKIQTYANAVQKWKKDNMTAWYNSGKPEKFMYTPKPEMVEGKLIDLLVNKLT